MKLPGLLYTSPKDFTLKERMQLSVGSAAVANLYKSLLLSTTYEVRHPEHLEDAIGEYGGGVLGVWHEVVGLLLWQHRGRNFHSTASFSFDGELAARVVSWFGVETVRGSSSMGGSGALEQLIKATPQVECTGLTMDGPRGPRRVAKPGIAILAARTQRPILPQAVALTKRWRVNSWDRLLVPKPFARVICEYAPPIPPPPDDAPEHVEKTRLEVERVLNEMHGRLEDEVGDTQEVDPPPAG